MAFGITVPYQIVVDSGAHYSGIREGAPREGPWAEVRFKCLWDDRYQLCQDLLGTWVVMGNPGAPPYLTIMRQPAFQYPSAPQLFCTDIIGIESMGKPIVPRFLAKPWMTGQLAIVTARFGVPGYTQDGSDQSGQPYTRLSVGVSGEILTLPDTTYLFADGTPTMVPIGLVIPQIEFTWCRHRMPAIPDVAMSHLTNCVNSDSFAVSRTFTAAPGTLLFMPGQCEVEGHSQAMFSFEYGYTISYIVEYKFIWRPIPWNYSLYPDRTSGFLPVTDGNGNYPHTPIAFTGALP